MPSPADSAVDDRRAGLVEALAAELGDALVASQLAPAHDPWVRVHTDAWVAAGQVARDGLGLQYFCFLSAIDWLPSPFGRGEEDPTQPSPERSTRWPMRISAITMTATRVTAQMSPSAGFSEGKGCVASYVWRKSAQARIGWPGAGSSREVSLNPQTSPPSGPRARAAEFDPFSRA